MFTIPPCNAEAWVIMQNHTLDEGVPRILDACYFPPQHAFINKLAEMFVTEYPTRASEMVACGLFHLTLLKLYGPPTTVPNFQMAILLL